MRKIILTIGVMLFAVVQSFAHYLWIETSAKGEIGKEQEIRVYFGEYTYGVKEKIKGEAYMKVKDFTLWVVDAQGKKIRLNIEPKDDYYAAAFTPDAEGTYTVILDNDKIDVVDFTKYNFGIFKTHYHAVSKIQVGDKANHTVADNAEGVAIKNISEEKGKVKLKVFYKGKALPESEITVFVADQWSKTLETDQNGIASFDLPWKTKYVVEVTKKEEVPGTYKDVAYEFIWHATTVSVNANL
ncbi:DUF4198 domain-containing protein [Flammeovirgaceae bacterium SG7u.111]|nr:DUF4198 domain-containing protein [Flammeovirgaceae bacterium SG7u.132]WPO33053.1 DUF4198 domain-containing protein [Flammeovirgaceae bacterium SG7u.111]